MTRKDFELIAGVIAKARRNNLNHDGLAEMMAIELKKKNPNFNEERFLDAIEKNRDIDL